MERFAGLYRYINKICIGMCPMVSIPFFVFCFCLQRFCHFSNVKSFYLLVVGWHTLHACPELSEDIFFGYI